MPIDRTPDETMGCEEALQKLAIFLDGELDARESDQVRRHLETCRSCFSRMEFERRLKERIRDQLRVEAISSELETRVRALVRSLPGNR
jgi:anti-sigma factor (TIGR02949 family)